MTSMRNRAERVQRLSDARRIDSKIKREKAIDVANHLHKSGLKVTFARVAREAGVSSWLVYNAPEVRNVIDDLMNRQSREGVSTPSPLASPDSASVESLRTDLLLLREEMKQLRAENSKYRSRLRERLGEEVEEMHVPDLIARVHELETLNGDQQLSLTARGTEIEALRERVDELQIEKEGQGEALRRLIFTSNVTRGKVDLG